MKKLLLFLAIIFSTHSHALEFQGKFLQGHFILGKAEAGSKVFVDKTQVKVSEDGYFVFGIDRDRKFDVAITEINNGKKNKIIKKVFKRKYNIQRIDGLPENKVTPPESVYKRIKEENGRIGKARAINSDLTFFTGQFIIQLKELLVEFTVAKEFLMANLNGLTMELILQLNRELKSNHLELE